MNKGTGHFHSKRNTQSLNQDDIRVYFNGTSAKVQHIATGIEVIEHSLDSQHKNYLKAWMTLQERISNHKNIRVKANNNKILSVNENRGK